MEIPCNPSEHFIPSKLHRQTAASFEPFANISLEHEFRQIYLLPRLRRFLQRATLSIRIFSNHSYITHRTGNYVRYRAYVHMCKKINSIMKIMMFARKLFFEVSEIKIAGKYLASFDFADSLNPGFHLSEINFSFSMYLIWILIDRRLNGINLHKCLPFMTNTNLKSCLIYRATPSLASCLRILSCTACI